MGGCLGKIASNVIFFSEKFSMCASFTVLITCVITSMICMLAFGIGLGYNYSYVDFRTKFTYLTKEGYRKTRPTSYHGTGYYKPTTLNDSAYYQKYGRTKSKPTRKKSRTTKPWRRFGNEAMDHGYPNHLPNESPRQLLDDIAVPVPPRADFGPRMEGIYFSTLKPKPKPYHAVGMTKGLGKDIKAEANTASNAIYMNARKDITDAESISVNVTKVTRDSTPPLIIKTMMHPNQLMTWLSRLREANKTFAVHIITD